MLLDFNFDGKNFGMKIWFQIFFKIYVQKNCINLLRTKFSNNIFTKKITKFQFVN